MTRVIFLKFFLTPTLKLKSNDKTQLRSPSPSPNLHVLSTSENHYPYLSTIPISPMHNGRISLQSKKMTRALSEEKETWQRQCPRITVRVVHRGYLIYLLTLFVPNTPSRKIKNNNNFEQIIQKKVRETRKTRAHDRFDPWGPC
jgi:hypothetical protein